VPELPKQASKRERPKKEEEGEEINCTKELTDTGGAGLRPPKEALQKGGQKDEGGIDIWDPKKRRIIEASSLQKKESRGTRQKDSGPSADGVGKRIGKK